LRPRTAPPTAAAERKQDNSTMRHVLNEPVSSLFKQLVKLRTLRGATDAQQACFGRCGTAEEAAALFGLVYEALMGGAGPHQAAQRGGG
jgi:hypothetical protein